MLTTITFLQTPTRATQGTKGSPQGTRKPAGSCRRARECYTKPSPPRRMERSTPKHEPRHPNRQTPHCRQAGRQADTNTSTAPPNWSSTLGLPWGAQGCTKGDRRSLATDGGVHMNSTGEAERTAEEHCEIPDDGLCV